MHTFACQTPASVQPKHGAGTAGAYGSTPILAPAWMHGNLSEDTSRPTGRPATCWSGRCGCLSVRVRSRRRGGGDGRQALPIAGMSSGRQEPACMCCPHRNCTRFQHSDRDSLPYRWLTTERARETSWACCWYVKSSGILVWNPPSVAICSQRPFCAWFARSQVSCTQAVVLQARHRRKTGKASPSSSLHACHHGTTLLLTSAQYGCIGLVGAASTCSRATGPFHAFHSRLCRLKNTLCCLHPNPSPYLFFPLPLLLLLLPLPLPLPLLRRRRHHHTLYIKPWFAL